MSLVDVLQEDEELEEEASAVLAGSDSDHCSYPQVSITVKSLGRFEDLSSQYNTVNSLRLVVYSCKQTESLGFG